MLVLFENLTLVCMLVNEAFQSSIAFTFPNEFGGLFLQRFLIAIDCCWKSHTLYWSGGGAGSLPHVEQVGALSMYTVATRKDLLSYCISRAFHGRRRLYTSVRFLLIYQTSCLRPSV